MHCWDSVEHQLLLCQIQFSAPGERFVLSLAAACVLTKSLAKTVFRTDVVLHYGICLEPHVLLRLLFILYI